MDDDLYDEFGNFIGEEVEASEEESEHGVDVGNYAYDDYAEAAPEATVEEHMDIDGTHWRERRDDAVNCIRDAADSCRR
jgi:U5 small nuclear ribonucleoprotein component